MCIGKGARTENCNMLNGNHYFSTNIKTDIIMPYSFLENISGPKITMSFCLGILMSQALTVLMVCHYQSTILD
jgi:hypothetical protein